jgi:hypothetical protein
MFETPKQSYPKSWKEMSVDFKLLFAYHGCMMVLFVVGRSLTVRQEVAITGVIVILLVALSVRRRRVMRWRWPGVRGRDVLFAISTVILIAFFLFAATPLFPPSQSYALPWYLAGLGIGTFGTLQSLRIVQSSELEFLSCCRVVDQFGREIERASELQKPKAIEVSWKRAVRVIYSVLFLLVWITGVAYFYYFGIAFRAGSPTPTASQTEPLFDHGITVYITQAESRRVMQLRLVSFVGGPLIVVAGLVLHFIVGVKVFGETPSPG